MTAFAYYRLPCEQHATYVAQHVGEPEILSSVAQLNGKEGFVIAPFQPSAECSVVLIHPDEKRVIHLTGENFEGDLDENNSDGGLKDENGGLKGNGKSEEKDGYVRDFGCFHGQLQKGVFRKIVLARRSVQTTRLSAEALFAKACRMYPRLFVALVCSEASGMWLMATPRGAAQWACGRVPHHVACRHSESAHDILAPHPSRGDRGPGVAAEGPGGAAVRHRLYRGVHQDLLRRLSSAGSLHDDGGPSVSSAYRHPFPSALCRRAGRCARSALSHASRVWHSQGASPQVYPAS